VEGARTVPELAADRAAGRGSDQNWFLPVKEVAAGGNDGCWRMALASANPWGPSPGLAAGGCRITLAEIRRRAENAKAFLGGQTLGHYSRAPALRFSIVSARELPAAI